MKQRRGAILLVVAVVIAGLLLWQGLANATVYFKTADEAVAQRVKLGDKRFRLEGLVKAGSVHEVGNAVEFVVIGDHGAEVAVHHEGDPPQLFRANVPVVLEGHFRGATFQSDRILVKHSEDYREEHKDRVKDYVKP